MNDLTQPIPGHEPNVQTVEMVCDRLAELGLAVGPETARALVREILTAEGPRVDARLREALDTTLQTIRTAAQSAMGMLATTASEARSKEAPPPPEQLHVSRRPSPQHPPAPAPPPRRQPPAEPKKEPRQSGPRRPRIELDEDERRPVFRRPGRR